MRLTLLRISAIVVFIIQFSFTGLSQANCISNNLNGTVINLACNQVCTDLVLPIPHLKSTDDYVVKSVPYTPYPYVTSAPPLLLPCANQDDKFFDTTFLPFNFCFYGANYSKLVVSSNGLVTFDSTNALRGSHWSLSTASQLPFTGTGIPTASNNCPTPGGTLFPRATIFGVYYDIDIDFFSPNKKMEVHVEGAAPCRKFVISFFEIPLFSCTSLLGTNQIVLHESTGIVEVFVANKPACSWNGGLAIIGMQDWTRTKAVTPPGKNCAQFSETNTGYRFIPNGGASRFLSTRLYTMDGSLVATGDTLTTTPGMLDLRFPTVCPPAGSTQYRIVTIFSSCDNPAVTLTSSDTITINRNNGLNATATATNTSCGPPTGTISVNVPAGTGVPPYTFVLDGTVTQTGNSPMIFTNVPAGPHTIVITDASGGCTSTINVTVNRTNNLAATLTPAATACPGANNGSITVTPANGFAPYTFTLNPGGVVLTGNTAVFTGLPAGNYNVTIVDAAGCLTSTPLATTVGTGPSLIVNFTQTATVCQGSNTGSATITPGNGNGPFTFTLDGTIIQIGATSTTFTGLSAGIHTVVVRDASGCNSNPITINIAPGPALVTTANNTNVLCNGSSTATITVAPPNPGNPPFQYSLDGVTWQNSNVFNNLPAGTHTVYFRESGGCTGQLTQTITEPPLLNFSATTVAAVCNSQNNGIIAVVASGGVPPYQYSINGGSTWQSRDSFFVNAGTYTVTIRDNNQCTTSQTVTVTQPGGMTASAATTNGTCNGGNDGTITLSVSGGNPGYEYSLAASTFQSSNVFNVTPGTYTAVIRDVLGCTVTVPNIVVGVTNDLTFTPPVSPTICEGSSTQLEILSNALRYNWTPAGTLNNPGIYNPTASPTITTTYSVTLTYGFCTAVVPVTVNVNPAPIPDAGPDGYICYGQKYQLQGSGGTSFQWTPSTYLDDPLISNPQSTPGRTITYALSVVDANGCPSLRSDNIKVDVTPPIKVQTYPFDTVAYDGDQFPVLAISGATDYLWTPSTGLSDPTIPNPILTTGAIGDVIVYKVTAYTQAGCKGEGFVRVKVYKGPELYVPTGFTPNGDGKNDRFFPFPVGVKSIKYFRVFNRWGQMVFSTSTLNDGWDGRFGGKEQAAGVYVWVVEGFTKDDRPITHKGTVALIR